MEIYEIQPASNSIFFMVIPLFLILLFILFLILFAFFSSKNAKFLINENTLEIKASVYSRRILLNEIKRDEVKLLNLMEDSSWSIKWRTNGIGLLGYNEGWYTLKNGQKGLLFLTSKEKVVLIPTIHNYFIMISPKDPIDFIQALKQ